MRPIVLAFAAVAVGISACGAPDELSTAEGRQLEIARDRVIAALELNRKLASPAAAGRILARVRKIVATGALEPRKLDEFGLAALGELRLAAPSLVIVDRLEVPRELDREALTALLDHATTDADAASKVAAENEVEAIGELLDDTGADADTHVPVIDRSVQSYLDDLQARLGRVWPDLASDLAD